MTRDRRPLVFVVDDEAPFGRLVERWLQGSEYRVEVLTSGEACLQRLPKALPDVVLLDRKMPGMDGIATLQALKSRRPELPVIMVASNANANAVVEAMKNGAADYLAKPPSRTRLLTTLRDTLETHELRQAVTDMAQDGHGFAGMVGDSAAMQQLFRTVRRVARSDVAVLVLGESGVGKELVARALHTFSVRSDGPFVALNCAAIPQDLQESELFGHERGSFTGASTSHRGRFEEADGGTLFLDEIGELSPSLQAKLLRVLQDGTFRRVGSSADRSSSFRLVSATHQPLYEMASGGAFRQDLYYRLAVFEVDTPPLRSRGEDVMLLAETFAGEFSRAMDLPSCSFSADARRVLRRHDWPGNVRELRNAMHYAVMLSGGGTVHAEHLPERLKDGGIQLRGATPRLPSVPWQELERLAIDQALERTDGRMVEAAELLGINRTTLYRKLRKHRSEG